MLLDQYDSFKAVPLVCRLYFLVSSVATKLFWLDVSCQAVLESIALFKSTARLNPHGPPIGFRLTEIGPSGATMISIISVRLAPTEVLHCFTDFLASFIWKFEGACRADWKTVQQRLNQCCSCCPSNVNQQMIEGIVVFGDFNTSRSISYFSSAHQP